MVGQAMRVFVFEYVCGGGMVREAPDGCLVQQSAAVLRAVVESFERAGTMVLTTLDYRAKVDLGGAQVLTVGPEDRVEGVLDQLAAEADWALVIAPEIDGILESWSRKLTAAGARRLGSRPDAIALCADKLAFARAMRAARIRVPATTRVDAAQGMNPPLVVKRRNGAGCQDVFVVRSHGELASLPYSRECIVQPLVEGTAVACSFLVHGSKRTALPAVQQIVEIDHTIRLRGVRTPVEPVIAERARRLAEGALERIPGLRGFVGVDVIVAPEPERDVVLEVNPRPTMAFAALHGRCLTSLARALVEPDAPLRWSDEPYEYDLRGPGEPAARPQG